QRRPTARRTGWSCSGSSPWCIWWAGFVGAGRIRLRRWKKRGSREGGIGHWSLLIALIGHWAGVGGRWGQWSVIEVRSEIQNLKSEIALHLALVDTAGT